VSVAGQRCVQTRSALFAKHPVEGRVSATATELAGALTFDLTYDAENRLVSLTWNNAPAADTNLLASLGSVSINTWYEVDVTSLVTGDGTYSFRISDSVGGADYSSKEGANDPELVITLGGTPGPTKYQYTGQYSDSYISSELKCQRIKPSG
jgi:hypothetical protein